MVECDNCGHGHRWIPAEVQHQLDEQQSEIDRHHRDFSQISALVEEALLCDLGDGDPAMDRALKAIRNIVG